MQGSAVARGKNPYGYYPARDPRRLAPDVDMRSPDGRMYLECYDRLAGEYPDADPFKLRDIALLRFELEKARAAGTLTLEDSVRVLHLVERRERALRLAQQRKRLERDKGGQSLNEYLDSLSGGGG